MSIKIEQYQALKNTRNFLRELLTPERPKTARELKEKATRCLRHFPFLKETGEPIFSKDEFK